MKPLACHICGKPAVATCDYNVAAIRTLPKACSRPLCAEHTHKPQDEDGIISDEIDYCPVHWKAVRPSAEPSGGDSLPSARTCTVEIYYPGSCISVNHYLKRGDGYAFVLGEARGWKEALGWVLKPHHLEKWRLPLSVRCDARFADRAHACDLSNLSKCTLDAIQEVSGVNDRNMRWQDGDITYGHKPALTITVTEAE